jgi:catechol 2,3-dioxygenase-like lactoylglutathione lyase family enzyme
MPLRRLDHVLVLTDDLERTRDFYCEVLGLEAGERPPLPFPGFWFTLNGAPCVHVAERAAYDAHAVSVGLAESPAPIDHVAFAADGYEQLAVRLRAAGVGAVENDPPGAPMRQLFFSDPNGVRIELNVGS